MDYKIAYQLYSARDVFDDDPIGILKKIKEYGYDGVELAGYYGLEPAYLRGVADTLGLELYSIHLSYWTLTENVNETVRRLRTLGCRYAAIPGAFGMFIGEEGYDRFVAGFAKLGRELRANGIQLMYHNHGFELEKVSGDLALNVLYNSFDKEDVMAELDVGFATYHGIDPVSLIKRYRNRVPALHLKDFKLGVGTPGDFSTFACPAGEGELNLPAILKAGEFSGTKLLVVEQDSATWNGKDCMECAKISATNLKRIINSL